MDDESQPLQSRDWLSRFSFAQYILTAFDQKMAYNWIRKIDHCRARRSRPPKVTSKNLDAKANKLTKECGLSEHAKPPS